MRRFMSIAVFVVALVGGVHAQGSFLGSRSSSSLEEVGSSYLLAPAVQKELKLSAATSKKIKDLFTNGLQKASTPTKGGNQQEEIKARIEAIRKVQTQMVAMLTPAQRSRLKQITIQQMGASGMVHPEVKAALKLTPDQERKVNAIVRDGMQMMFASMKPATTTQPSRADMEKRIKEMQAKQEEWRVKMINLALKELNSTQKSKWKALCGKPFKMDYSGMDIFGKRG